MEVLKYKDCLSCTNSVSMDDELGEQVLFCTRHGFNVSEEECCEEFEE